MDQDVPMGESNAKNNGVDVGDDLAKYNLDDYDEEDTMPG